MAYLRLELGILVDQVAYLVLDLLDVVLRSHGQILPSHALAQLIDVRPYGHEFGSLALVLLVEEIVALLL